MSCFENTSYQINEIYLTRCKQLWCVSVLVVSYEQLCDRSMVHTKWVQSKVQFPWSMGRTMQLFWSDQKSLYNLPGEWVTQWFWSKQVNGRWDNSVNGQWRSWNNSPANNNSRGNNNSGTNSNSQAASWMGHSVHPHYWHTPISGGRVSWKIINVKDLKTKLKAKKLNYVWGLGGAVE